MSKSEGTTARPDGATFIPMPVVCQCIDGLPCSRVHRLPGETSRRALLRRLRSSIKDPIGIESDPTSGAVDHEVYGVLVEDMDTILALVGEWT